MIVVIAALVALVTIIALMLVRRQRARIKRARQLAAGTIRPATAAAVARAAAQLTEDDNAAERLARLAHGMFSRPRPDGLPPGAELPGTAEALSRLEWAVATYTQAADYLASQAADKRAGRLTAALRDISNLPADAGPDALAGAVGRHAARPATGTAARASTAGLAAVAQAAGQHAAAKAAVTADLGRLGLSEEWADLNRWPDYVQRLAACDRQATGLAREFAQRLSMAWDREATALGEALAKRRVTFGREQAAKLAPLVRQASSATAAYAEQVRGELDGSRVEATATMRLLDALPGRLNRGTRLLENGRLAAALTELAARPLPLAQSWAASEQYEAAWENLDHRLDEFARQYQRRTARETAAMADELRHRMELLGQAAGAARRTWHDGQDAAWAPVKDAVAHLAQNAVCVLADLGTDHDGTDPVRAATAVLTVDQVAAANVAQIVRDGFPVIPGTVIESEVAEDHLSATEKIMAQLGRNSVALSGLDGLLAPLLAAADPVSGPGLAVAMASLTPVPAEISRALGDVVTFAHNPFGGITPAGMVHGVINHVQQNLVPHVGPLVTNHGFLALAGSAVKIPSELHGNLLATVLAADAPLAAVGKFVGETVASTYLHDAVNTPLVQAGQHELEAAAHHTAHAAAAAAPDFLHGVLAHVPFVTIALSTTREIRLYQNNKTTLDKAVGNIIVDTASVATGLAAGEVAAHFAVGAHSAFVTVPFTLAGSLVARKIAKSIKQRPYKEAVARYAETESRYSGQAAQMASQLSAAARGAIAQQRSGYLAVVGKPPSIEQAATAELAALTTGLRAATAAYLAVMQSVLEAAAPPAAEYGAGTPAGARPTLAASLVQSLADCDRHLAAGRYAEALLALAALTLPVPQTWRPSRDYRAQCAAVAARISELSDEQRLAMARWAASAVAEFRDRNEKVGAIVTRKAEAISQERTTAETALREAAEAVEREARALGMKKPGG
jgi:hypothetical protein